MNATEHVEQCKRQNAFRSEDIDKIVETYQTCPEIVERYARRVSMEEIEKNDYNLNISRYVSTSKAEEEIDLAAVHSQLADIEARIADARAKHNQYLKELDLPPL